MKISLQDLGIPEEGYLMIVIYHPDGRPLEGYPTFARVGDISSNDHVLIAVGFRGSAVGCPYISCHEFSEAIADLFDTIKPGASPPTPDNPFVVYGVVEVRLWKDTRPIF